MLLQYRAFYIRLFACPSPVVLASVHLDFSFIPIFLLTEKKTVITQDPVKTLHRSYSGM
jgi:hypothetical protein